MQWEFRKALKSLETYKQANPIKNDIQNGDQQVLGLVIRQIDIILADPNQNIITKVLAIRFVKDIMIFGREEIVKKVQKLLPHYVKLCSYQCHISNPNRGQTYFHSHPDYLKLTKEEQKKQIDTLGSTFLILGLQSIYFWSRWIPNDTQNQPSLYLKSYQTLVDRGVAFPSAYHYFKQSDTQKFKKMYRIQFFTDSFQSYSQNPSFGPRQKLEEDASKQNSNQYQLPRNIEQIKQQLNNLRKNKSSKLINFKKINNGVQKMYKQKGNKQDKLWMQKYLAQFNLLQGNRINFQQFYQNVLSEQIILNQQQYPIKVKTSKNSKLEGSSINQVSSNQKILKQKVATLLNEIQLKQKQIKALNQQKVLYQQKQNQKQQKIKAGNKQVKIQQQLILNDTLKQKDKIINQLKLKIIDLQQQISSLNYLKTRQKQLQNERNHLLSRLKRLQIQNQKIIHISNEQQKNQLKNYKSFVQQKDKIINTTINDNKKYQKIISNLQKQINIYKKQLNNEKIKNDPKTMILNQNNQSLTNQNKQLKQIINKYKKIISQNQYQILRLNQQYASHKMKIKQLQKIIKDNQKLKLSNKPIIEQNIKQKSKQTFILTKNQNLKYLGYNDLYLQLKPNNKQMFLRACKCGLKNKQILSKDSQLQVGIISQIIDQQKLRFIIHITNISDDQIDNIKINKKYSQTQSLSFQFSNNFIFCLHPRQQEKCTIIVSNIDSPYIRQRALIQLKYQKNQQKISNSLILPFFITKFYDFLACKGDVAAQGSVREVLQFKYSKKMLSKPSALINYFQKAKQISTNIYELQAYHRQTDLKIKLKFQININKQILIIDAQIIRAKINQKQRYAFQQLLSFLQISFKK